VKYSDSVRKVFLERGRALFHVAKNPYRPFLVQADDTTVRAVGTTFGVEQVLQGVIVTVAEGKVAVLPTSRASVTAAQSGKVVQAPERPSTENPAAGEVLLSANQQVEVQNSGSAEAVREIDSQRALAWARGRLIFQNDQLGLVVAEFNRYNRVQLTVADPELAAKPVSGVFNAAEPEAFLAFLQSVTNIEIVRDGDRSITIESVRHR
jgi:transmembrane sensor